jgi:hypothetical protein
LIFRNGKFSTELLIQIFSTSASKVSRS